jgi:hypothetical protein
MTRFGTFWFGTLSPYETSCLASFIKRGCEVVLYSFEEIRDLPAGVLKADAREIVDRTYLDRFITNRAINVAAFSDYFRYLMFLKTDLCWTDTDIFMLQSFEVNPNENFFVVEDGRNICNALLRINGASSELKELITKTESILDKDVPWAAAQTFNSNTFRKKWHELAGSLKLPEEFMPIHYNEYYKFILPEFANECADRCATAKTIHLYNNILDKIGVCKNLLPPEGSYLNHLFTSQGHESNFWGVYPAPVMRTLVDGWRMRNSGECLGAKAIIKQALPSLNRTIRRLIWKYL